MNLLIWLILGIIVLIVSRKLFFAGALGFLQYKSHVLIKALRLDVIPLVNLDFELSNIIMIFVTLIFGIPFAFFIMFLNIIIHFTHEELTGIETIIDYIVLNSVLVLVISVSGSFSSIPYAIIASKIVGIFMSKLLGSDLFSVSNFKEVFTMVLYLAVFGIL